MRYSTPHQTRRPSLDRRLAINIRTALPHGSLFMMDRIHYPVLHAFTYAQRSRNMNFVKDISYSDPVDGVSSDFHAHLLPDSVGTLLANLATF